MNVSAKSLLAGAAVLVAAVVALLGWPDESSDSAWSDGAKNGSARASGEVRTERRDLPTERAPVDSSPRASSPDAEDATAEPPSKIARIAEARERFARYWDEFRSEFYAQMDANRDGDRYMRTSRKYWGNFHPAFLPSEEMTAGLPQTDKYAVLKILKAAGKTLPETRDGFGGDLTPEELLALEDDLRDRSLFHSPELTIERVLGPESGWEEDEAFVSEARALWREMLLLLAPVENEAWALERCATKAWGGGGDGYVGNVDLSLVAPELGVAADTRTKLCREFHARLSDLAKDYRD